MQGCYRLYSYLQGQIEKGRSIDESSRIDCPCCLQNQSKIGSVTFDACFGCTGKEVNAQNPIEPFHSEDYILRDLTEEEVMTDVKLKLDKIPTKMSDKRKARSGLCDLRATEYAGSTKTENFQGLRFTGLMGSVCKHDFPLFFMNIMYGKEKLVFASRIWEHLSNLDLTTKWNAKYDIMCSFEKYLADRGRRVPDITAIPDGHSKFHRWFCQELWGPLSVKGNGLMVGEEIELLWKVLMMIWPKIKEMSPENRRDEITDHLIFRAEQCTERLHNKLADFARRAEKTYLEACNELDNNLCGLTEERSDQWYEQYSTAIAASDSQAPTWQETYAGLLYDLYNNQYVEHERYRKGITLQSKRILEDQIRQLERQKDIGERWGVNSVRYQESSRRYMRNQLEVCRRKVVAADNDQFFYVQTMRHQKHGHKGYRKRVDTAKQISKASVARHQALERWNIMRGRLYPDVAYINIEQFTQAG